MADENDEDMTSSNLQNDPEKPQEDAEPPQLGRLLLAVLSPLTNGVTALVSRFSAELPEAEKPSEKAIDEVERQIKEFFGSAELRAAIQEEFSEDGKESRKGLTVDFTAIHPINKILDEEAFMRWLFNYVPDNTVWAIEHELDDRQLGFLQRFGIDDEIDVAVASIYPRRNLLKIRLDSQSKSEIVENLAALGIGWEIVHQHVYKGDLFYLSAYDCLSFVGLSQTIPAEEIARLEAAQIIVLTTGT